MIQPDPRCLYTQAPDHSIFLFFRFQREKKTNKLLGGFVRRLLNSISDEVFKCSKWDGKEQQFSENTRSQQVLEVAPLNSLPYIGPLTGHTSRSGNRANENAGKGAPAMIFLPSESPAEFNKLIALTKTGVALTGSAAMGKIGPTIGLVDIAESDDSYYFRVSLPGVSRDEKDFSCEIEPDGKILIKGATTTGEKTVCKYNQVFKMLTQNLCPPGHFTISFQLPGHVSNEEFTGNFGADGVLEGVVKKLYYED